MSELCIKKITKVRLDELNENLCMDNGNLDEELSSICHEFISELQKVLDTIAPKKKVKLFKRRRTPCYDSDVKEQWKFFRNYERCWMRYGDNSHWYTYKHERNW